MSHYTDFRLVRSLSFAIDVVGSDKSRSGKLPAMGDGIISFSNCEATLSTNYAPREVFPIPDTS
jgi:hypothetical protein